MGCSFAPYRASNEVFGSAAASGCLICFSAASTSAMESGFPSTCTCPPKMTNAASPHPAKHKRQHAMYLLLARLHCLARLLVVRCCLRSIVAGTLQSFIQLLFLLQELLLLLVEILECREPRGIFNKEDSARPALHLISAPATTLNEPLDGPHEAEDQEAQSPCPVESSTEKRSSSSIAAHSGPS